MCILGTIYVTTYQDVFAPNYQIVSGTVTINDSTVNGPDLSTEDEFGVCVANIGDRNNDGIVDIAVGAHYDDTGGTDNGAVHIMFMNRNGTVSSTIEINSDTTNGPVLKTGDHFGTSVADIGDLNGDGTSDIAVGAPYDDTGGTSRGAVHIMFMNNDTSILSTAVINSDTANGPELDNTDYFGYSIANIGDRNNDGISDIAVGAYHDDGNGTNIGGATNAHDGANVGAVHIMLMNRNGTVSDTIEINNNTVNGPVLSNDDNFGVSITDIGDLNGDGISEIAVGAHGNDNVMLAVGAVHIMFMNNDTSILRTVEISDNMTNGPELKYGDHLGSSITGIGDMNKDGTPDIAVGTFGTDISTDNLSENSGSAFIIFMNGNGSAYRTVEINNNTVNGPVLRAGDSFGKSIAPVGDLNNDTVTDIIVGAFRDDTGGNKRGAVHVLFIVNDDKQPPVITNITSDATDSSILKVGDTISFRLDLNSTESNASVNGTYNSIPLLWNSTNDGTTYIADYTVSEGETDQTTPLQITNVTITDSLGNTSLPFNGTDILSTIDANSPKFVSGKTLSISRIVITLDHNVTDNTARPNDFTLGGVASGSIDSIVSVLNNTVTLDIVEAEILDSDYITISYNRTVGSFDEISGNSLLNFTGDVTNNLDTPPVITLTGDNPQIIELGDGYTELGATTNDGSPVIINSTEFVDALGTYHTYYDSTDVSGFNAIQVNRTVFVVDTTPPIIALIGENPQIIKLGDGYTELGATTNDGFPVSINSDEFMDEVCSYSIYYDSVDASGNNAFQRIRTVNVVDSTPPPSCIIPDSGKWTINGNCMVDSDVTAPGDVLVQNHSTLTVPSGVTLDIDFTEFNLTVQYCSGVSVKSGGTLT